MAENESASLFGEADASEESQTPVGLFSTEVGGTSDDSLTPRVDCASPVKITEEPVDIFNESNLKSKKSASKTPSISTRRRLELEAVSSEEHKLKLM